MRYFSQEKSTSVREKQSNSSLGYENQNSERLVVFTCYHNRSSRMGRDWTGRDWTATASLQAITLEAEWVRPSRACREQLKRQHQLLQNILTKAAGEALRKTNNAGKRNLSKDQRKEMDHEGKVASQRSDGKTLHPRARVVTLRL